MNKNKELEIYLREISRVPFLEINEEKEITQRAKNGDWQAKNRLIEGHLRFVVWVVRVFYMGFLEQNQKLAFLDLIQAGNLGLFDAIKGFKPEKDKKFRNYAFWWIRRSINYVLCYQNTIKMSPHNLRLINLMNKINALYLQKKERWPSNEEKAKEMKISIEKVDKLLQFPWTISLDSPIKQNDGWGSRIISDFIPDEKEIRPEQAAYAKALKEKIEIALSGLTLNEVKVIRMYFLQEKDSLTEISKILKLSRERIRQIRNKAIQKLQHPRRKRLLEEFAAE